ncbi:MAG: hypothetical protein HY426_05155 [Candidatus Levybacteria bacterium]|nr:hypothetical protein [Candidatus Levybacteria bacterium]
MSPEVVLEDAVGKAIKKLRLSDAVGSRLEEGGTSAVVVYHGVVKVESDQLMGAQDFLTGKRVNGGGVIVDYSRGMGSVDLRREVDGVVSSLSVVARPLAQAEMQREG